MTPRLRLVGSDTGSWRAKVNARVTAHLAQKNVEEPEIRPQWEALVAGVCLFGVSAAVVVWFFWKVLQWIQGVPQ